MDISKVKGCGTSLLTLYIPADEVKENIIRILKYELERAKYIKSRITSVTVTSALVIAISFIETNLFDWGVGFKLYCGTDENHKTICIHTSGCNDRLFILDNKFSI